MSVADSKGSLSKSAKDLFGRWSELRTVWSDAQSAEFEKMYLSQLEQDVRSALGALERIDQVLAKIRSDCE